MRRSRGLARVVVAATCALAIGCDGGSGVDGDAAVDAAPGGDLPSCIEACTAKAAECGAPADAAALECEGLCRGGSSPTQVDCLRRTSCEELVGAFSAGGELCGLGGSVVPDGGPPDGGPPDGGPGACTIGDRRCPEDYVAFRCEELAGRPLQVTEDCPSPQQPCENGWCVDPSRPGLQSTCGSASDCRTPALCEAGLCCNPPGEVCTESADCCGGASCEATAFGFRACR